MMPSEHLLEQWLSDFRADFREMRAKLEELARLQADNLAHKDTFNRLFERIEAMEARLQKLEAAAPIMELVRKWVLGGIWAVVLAVVGAILALVLRSH